MKSTFSPAAWLVFASLLAAAPATFAHQDEPAQKPAASSAAYPLDTCVVSGDKLGEMGAPFSHVHREAGKPDRTVLLCCKGCIKDFQQDSARYLEELDDAAAAHAKGAADRPL